MSHALSTAVVLTQRALQCTGVIVLQLCPMLQLGRCVPNAFNTVQYPPKSAIRSSAQDLCKGYPSAPSKQTRSDVGTCDRKEADPAAMPEPSLYLECQHTFNHATFVQCAKCQALEMLTCSACAKASGHCHESPHRGAGRIRWHKLHIAKHNRATPLCMCKPYQLKGLKYVSAAKFEALLPGVYREPACNRLPRMQSANTSDT